MVWNVGLVKGDVNGVVVWFGFGYMLGFESC